MSICLIEVGIMVFDSLTIFHAADKHHFCFVGRETEPTDAVLYLRDLLAVGAVGIHRKQLSLAIDCRNKRNLCTAVNPNGIEFGLCRFGNLRGVGSVDIHHPKLFVALVGFQADKFDTIKNFLFVGRHLRFGDSTECLDELRCKLPVDNFKRRTSNYLLIVAGFCCSYG